MSTPGYITPVMLNDPNGFIAEWIKDVGRFIGGAIITALSISALIATAPLSLIPGLASVPQFLMNISAYGFAIMSSSWDETVYEDIKRIKWNPFNRDANLAFDSEKISFYKGTAVIRFENSFLSSFSFGMIFLERTSDVTSLQHEWGHTVQLSILGFAGYVAIVAIPSMTVNLLARKYQYYYDHYYDFLWESTADYFGGVNR
ncbi:MAG: hypothetical protein AB7U79_04505 [Candidatus Izemoplasmatales bacterium]